MIIVGEILTNRNSIIIALFIFCTGHFRLNMASPIISNLVLSSGEGNTATDESNDFVQVISFPKSHIWIWIGDQSGAQKNLSIAMAPLQSKNNCNIISSHILNSANPDETSLHSKGLAERISKKLDGKPVYLSCTINTNALDNKFLDNLEKQIIRLIKTDPDIFGM